MVEFANALRASEIANLPPWEIEDLVKLMDINSDGRIDLPELDIALLNIRNALGIEFVPYVEEEKQEEETVDNSEEEAEEEIAEEAEATDESETDEQVTEESEEEIAEEVEATDESDTDEEVTEESEEEEVCQKKSKQRMNLIPMRKSSKIMQNQWMIQQPLKMKI